MNAVGRITQTRLCRLVLAVLVALWSVPGLAWAVELEVLGDMTSPHGGFGTYQNLLKWSEKLNDVVWTATNVTPLADQTPTAPDGSTTADQLSFGGIGTVDSLAQDSGVASTADTYTFSLWLRSVSGATTLVLKIQDADESNTAIITTLSTTLWERYSVSNTFTSAGGNVIVTVLENAAGDAPVVLAWGAQLEKSGKANVYVRTDDEAVSSISQGLAVGKNVHVTGDLEIHGDIIQHGTQTGAPGNLKTKGNIEWKSGTTQTMTFDHAITADRTVTFPDFAGTVAMLERDQTFIGNLTLGADATNTLTVNAGPVSLVNATTAVDALQFGSGVDLVNLYR
ncbi:MAG: hypothetical protein HYZ89_02420, partial [Candidatus Omnitrophica bacterium]|nr:hypothetical protein [Candidatus Omnitrophota bacterium]